MRIDLDDLNIYFDETKLSEEGWPALGDLETLLGEPPSQRERNDSMDYWKHTWYEHGIEVQTRTDASRSRIRHIQLLLSECPDEAPAWKPFDGAVAIFDTAIYPPVYSPVSDIMRKLEQMTEQSLRCFQTEDTPRWAFWSRYKAVKMDAWALNEEVRSALANPAQKTEGTHCSLRPSFQSPLKWEVFVHVLDGADDLPSISLDLSALWYHSDMTMGNLRQRYWELNIDSHRSYRDGEYIGEPVSWLKIRPSDALIDGKCSPLLRPISTIVQESQSLPPDVRSKDKASQERREDMAEMKQSFVKKGFNEEFGRFLFRILLRPLLLLAVAVFLAWLLNQ